MSEINEKLLLHYLHNIDYLQTDQNVIGATTSTTLRTLPVPGGDIAYVRKFGTDYLITDVTDIENPVDVNMEFRVYANDGTLLGSRVGGGAFVDGAVVTAQGCYMEIEANGGAVVVLVNILVDTDIDVGGLDFKCAAETIQNGDTLTLYLSDTGSTYYDSAYMYGGDRHTPALNDDRLPYFNPVTGIAACASANDDGCEVLDSATYDMDITISLADFYLYATNGQTPTITSGVGARVTREVEHDGNNVDTRYVAKTGNDANPGTYQEPYLTIQFAENNMGGLAWLDIMDSNTYDETVTVNVDISIEPIYGVTPKIHYTGVGAKTLYLNHTGADVYGMTIDGNLTRSCVFIDINNFVGEIKNNTVYNGNFVNIDYNSNANIFNGTIERNISYNSVGNGLRITGFQQCSGSITKNIIYNNGSEGLLVILAQLGGTNTCDTTIENNICYNNSASGIYLTTAGTYSGNCENNTCWHNLYGLSVSISIFTGTIRDFITWNNTSYDLRLVAGAAVTITESCYLKNSGFTIGAGNTTNDPEFCSETIPYKFGISSDSPCYRTDTSSDDMGAHFRIIEINESTIEINGFLIDGQSQYNNAVYIVDAINHITNSLKWCSVYDFQGIAIDPYDDNTNTAFTVSNCKVYNNGNGIKLSYGGNTVEECLIYGNSVFGIHSDYINQTFNHNVFYGNQYGLYLESNSSGIIYKNNISHLNSLYGIYSEILMSITYCCITDGTFNVDKTDDSNIPDEPLFVNTDEDEENFHIKSKYGGYIHDSPCIDGSDDDPVKDIGAYDVLRSIANESWKKYQLESNPRNLDPSTKINGIVNITNAVGNLKRNGLATKRVFPLQYSDDDLQTQEQIETLQYISLLIPGIDGLKEADCEILLHLLPNQKLFEGTAGTIDATAKTIDDAAQTWNRNSFKGFWVGVKFTSGVDLVIDSALLTGTKAAAGWTIDEWIGYYFYHNYNYYYILSNTATVLTFSDPDGTLVSETAATYAIEKYFKILTNSKNQIYLEDEDDELITGSYDYYIDFILVQSVNKDFEPKQEGYFYQKFFAKTGFQSVFEEK